jgi:8-oxo-dGTP pyrophosphatase MutT (NUDIX family)
MPALSHVDVFLLLVRGDDVLLALRENTGYADGQWNFPSGKVEEGESAVAALLREAREEVGLMLDAADVRHVVTVHQRNPEGGARVGLFFRAVRWAGEPVNAEPHKCGGIAWYPLDAAPPNTFVYTSAGLDAFRAGESFVLSGWPS